MTKLRSLLAPLFISVAFAVTGCAADTADTGENSESSDSELRSVASSFFTRAPMSGRRLEAFRRALEDGDMGFVWVRNQGTVTGVQWETRSTSNAALTDAQRTALARAGLSYLGRRGARDVKPTADLEKALDTVGLYESSPDDASQKERAKMLDALRDIARTRGVTLFTATLHDAPDMYWENALIVVDEENEQLVVATGGFGT